mmetsp:Transcript_2496/g.6525  ORF Transcript_2496/g.6525 Transcript_2496/m.6525 type:complete len:132 (-) Transcript_2496:37-432(-)
MTAMQPAAVFELECVPGYIVVKYEKTATSSDTVWRRAMDGTKQTSIHESRDESIAATMLASASKPGSQWKYCTKFDGKAHFKRGENILLKEDGEWCQTLVLYCRKQEVHIPKDESIPWKKLLAIGASVLLA